MRICTAHWDALKKAIADRGIGHLGSKNSRQLHIAVVSEFEGRGAENEYDPLLACHFMVTGEALKVYGLVMLDPTAGWNCPICRFMEDARLACEREFIDGPADAALKHCRDLGLVPTPEPGPEDA